MIYVCDLSFNRLGLIGKFSYLLWRKRYSQHGETELHVDATSKNIQLLQKGNILFRRDDNEAMYIYYRGFQDDEQGRDQLIVKCFSLVRWLDRRFLWGKYDYKDTPESIARSMIVSECISPTNPDRIIPQIRLAPAKGFGTVIEKQISYANLLEQVESLCSTYEMGIRSQFNGMELLFDLYVGADRTVNQSINPRCILSKDFSNVLSRNYEEADNDFKNTVLIGGAGEGAERKLASIEQAVGLDRRELFVDARDLSDKKTVDGTEVTIPDEEYTLLLKQRGLEKLPDYGEFISFDCELDVTKENTKYGRDFFLGDLITIRDDKLGVVMNSRVVEVDEVFQQTKNIFVKIGESIPTLTEKVRKLVK